MNFGGGINNNSDYLEYLNNEKLNLNGDIRSTLDEHYFHTKYDQPKSSEKPKKGFWKRVRGAFRRKK